MAAQSLDPVPKEALAHNLAPAASSWAWAWAAAAVRLEPEDTVAAGRKVGTLDAAAALVAVLRLRGRGEAVGV